jgi:peptidoglycan lytic transglycosylase
MGILSKSPALAKKRRCPLVAVAAIAAAGLSLQACGTVDSNYARAPHQPVTSVPQPYSGAEVAPSLSHYDAVGTASWYGRPYHGRRTASGEVYNMNRMTAAHPTLPFGTRVAVTNLENGRTVILTINDRGPFKHDRLIDVSRKAARELGFLGQGLTRIGMRVVADQG